MQQGYTVPSNLYDVAKTPTQTFNEFTFSGGVIRDKMSPKHIINSISVKL